jgi:hypothetical protein
MNITAGSTPNTPVLGFLTVREAARASGLSEYDIRNAISKGQLQHRTQIVVTAHDLAAYQAERFHTVLDPRRQELVEQIREFAELDELEALEAQGPTLGDAIRAAKPRGLSIAVVVELGGY